MPTLYTEQKKYSDFLFVSRSILPSVQATKIWGSCHNFKCLKLVLKGPRLKLFARLKLSAPTVYLYVVKISFNFVSMNFLTKFCRNKMKHGLGKMKFRQNFTKFCFVTKQKKIISGKSYLVYSWCTVIGNVHHMCWVIAYV
jgi:hypothetical protein